MSATFVPKVVRARDWSPTNRAVLVDGKRVVVAPGDVFRVLVQGSNPPLYFYPPDV